MSNRRRKGFTLVELLVVISIIGMLVAIVIPAVQQSKESARQAVCANNQKQLALAMHQFHKAQGRFPGYYESMGVDTKFASWSVVILQYLDYPDVYRLWNKKAFRYSAGNSWVPAHDTHPNMVLDVMVCPSDPPTLSEDYHKPWNSPGSYAVNAGYVGDARYDSDGELLAIDDPNSENRANGVFHNLCPSSWSHMTIEPRNAKAMTMGYISSHDGNSNTVMLTESLQILTWRTVNTQIRNAVGVIWHQRARASKFDTTHAEYGRRINQDREWRRPIIDNNFYNISGQGAESAWLEPSNFADDNHARPSSYHAQGVNFAFCDGHTRFITEEIEYGVYKQLMTTNGARSDDSTDGQYRLDAVKF